MLLFVTLGNIVHCRINCNRKTLMKAELYTLVSNHIYGKYNERERKALFLELATLIEPNYLTSNDLNDATIDYPTVQRRLSVINEKQSIRKKKGVYYTPIDLVSFIVCNTVKELYGILTPKNLSDTSLEEVDAKDFCFKKTCYDPTCGTGEFLINTLTLKYDLAENKLLPLTRAKIHKIAKTIYGNDINPESTLVVKLRIFLVILEKFGVSAVKGIFKAISDNYDNYDFVSVEPNIEYDLVLGNPPFVEDSKYQGDLTEKFGNIYANILLNSAKSLHKNGAFGFVIPISYISTPRMKKIRDMLLELMPNQYILSYADRPDCLFTGVHQKLCIVIARKSDAVSIHTSQYNYWYSHERPALFNEIEVIKNEYNHSNFIPKLGNKLDVHIYESVSANKDNCVSNLKNLLSSGNVPVYLNMRATFWMKAFLRKHDSGEYKKYGCQTVEEASLAFCILNSSLFWWHWVCVSDCWHITNKELDGFKVPSSLKEEDYARCIELAKSLESKLEETKKFVGTKQTSHEYKHKLCLDEIHDIDDFINSLYNLPEKESEYVKSFAYKYRVGEGK